MKTPSLFWLLVIGSFGCISADSPAPRFKQGCVLLQKKIYCYGGGQYVEGGINYNRVFNDHFVLDLSKDFIVNDAQTAWTTLPTPTDFILEPNYSYSYTILSPTSYLITSGSGYNDHKTMLKNKTTIYHADKDQWESIPGNFNQTIGATANVDKNGILYLFGGIFTYTNTVPNDKILTLDIQNHRWSSSSIPSDTILRADHASAMDNNGMIYYVGGRLGLFEKDSYTWLSNVPMTSITTYDTTTQKWGNVAVSGTIPTVRNGHSFTFVPKTNQFILFGGKQGSSETPGTLDDICFTFDPTGKNWTHHEVAQIGSGTRFGHSAVLHMDLYLFIIFGADHITMSQNTFNVLDIETWTWLDNFSATGNPNVTSNTPKPTSGNDNNNGTKTSGDENSDDGSLGGGAITGIAVGMAALAMMVGTGIFLFYRRKRRHNQHGSSPPEYKPQDDFVMDYEFDNDPPPKEFTQKNYIATTTTPSNSTTNLNYHASYPLVAYHPDERVSVSTSPTYRSKDPTTDSPTITPTLVVDRSTRKQFKPDLTLENNHDDDDYLNKPFGSN